MNNTADLNSNPRRWRRARRALLGTALLITAIAVFYTVENWRGKRAWDRCRSELEAKGEVLDWTAYIPAPVADDLNFYKAPKMREWFVKENFAIGGNEPTNAPRPFVPAPRPETNVLVAEAQIVIGGNKTPEGGNATVLRFGDPAARQEVSNLLSQAVGPSLLGARGEFLFHAGLLKPVQIIFQAEVAPELEQVKAFFPKNLAANSPRSPAETSWLEVEPSGTNAYRISIKKPALGAADYLAWTDALKPQFELVRQALQRPYARIDCEYDRPFAIAVPNFIRMRTAVQILAERAQCHLLLGQPEAAWEELSLLHNLSETLLLKPAGKPLTLVGAMIYVAITGLHTAVVDQGLQLHAWREPQLRAIEQQLAGADVLSPAVHALREERAATCRTFELTSRRELLKLFGGGSKWLIALMPRGWFYQNMARGTGVEQELLGAADLTNRLVHPGPLNATRLGFGSEGPWPYWFLVRIAMPNFSKALQTAAFNQTLLDQARVGCQLERFRLAKGSYPGSLDELTPQFQLPHDVIGGGPLRYQSNGKDNYKLYSVGWNEKDDGGIAGTSKDEGDWGWELH